ncbi:DUF4843 domain-containing protein [Sphingobacterium faecale]|uniref:DUF4843 domain-containing protein n=1 Tax=Sphingobacterium faecale TaxID=2803775 RepID=A0ABS1R6Y7_9SPHI|nr:DUF4843 domain-containing protein [Sphingobacterium faecale]MBL1410418.1 DUF4843 domain-containing protein [Sphingobacterium faecale]
MKKINYYLGVIYLMLYMSSCQKVNLMTYDQPANIYFDLTSAQRDSVVYTFAYDMTKAVDTVFIPVRLMGHRTAASRHFRAVVEQDSSTAQAGTHYKALESQYPLAAATGRQALPLIVYNSSDLESNSVTMIVKLQPSDDFGIENKKLIRAYVVLSARLEKPIWWDMWMSAYSRTKHQLFLIVTAQRDLSMDGLDAPKNLYFANLLTQMLNDPFRWVTTHPEKGYVLTKSSENEDYDFYHKDNPGRVIKLKLNTGSGKYYFMDEQGKEVR